MKTNVLSDIEFIENSKMFVNEKKYYINLIDLLWRIGYYEERTTLKQIWSKTNG